jgi:hypothetical protein|nr:MAG TPA: JAKMIP CC3 domain [Caudoviricetes sp.]
MNYCIVNDENIIENIIVCENDDVALEFGAKPSYDGAAIGDTYSPPALPPTIDERVTTLESENDLLKQQLKAASDQNDFLEDCIAEMAEIVYA